MSYHPGVDRVARVRAARPWAARESAARTLTARRMLALAVAIAATGTPRPAPAQDIAGRLDQLMREYAGQRQFNGAVLVAQAGEVEYRAAFGLANVEWEVPNTPDSRFRIGSITKQFTAAIVLGLVENGILRLDAPVRDYLPGYTAPQGDRITIHHLLTHTSGLPSYTDLPGFVDEHSRVPTSPEEIVALTSSRPLEFEPGTRFRYSNSGYVLLGWIIEEVTGESYDRVLRERLLEPLELHDTGYDHESAVRRRRAFGYTRTLTGYANARDVDTSLPHAAGMMYSTVDDLFRWTRALHAGEVFRDPESTARMLRPYLAGYGCGVAISERQVGGSGRSVSVVEHRGGVFGFASVLRHIPEDGHTIVLLDNTSGNLEPIVDGITSVLYGEPAPSPRRSIAERILPVIESAGVEAGLQRYRERRRTRPNDYDYGPGQLLQLARHFLEADDTVTAMTLLKANVDEHPELPMPRLALAEILAGAGDTAAAVRTIESALTRRPGLPRLLSALRGLGAELDPALRLPVVDQLRPVLERCVGTYEVEPGVTLAIRLDEGGLTAQKSGDAAYRLLPQTETLFLLHGSRTQFAFNLDASGVAVSVTVAESGQQVTFPRM